MWRIHWETPFEQVLDRSNPPFARWFVGGKTNLCYNAVDRHLAARAQQNVLTETSIERRYTYAELHAEVNRMAAVMRSLGVAQGERVLIDLSADDPRSPVRDARLCAAWRDPFGPYSVGSRRRTWQRALMTPRRCACGQGDRLHAARGRGAGTHHAQSAQGVADIDRQLAPERLQAPYLVSYEPLREQFFDAHIPCV